ncbi:MAG: hypothetical protein ABI910_16690 [Gemmatimonadota bacterium]
MRSLPLILAMALLIGVGGSPIGAQGVTATTSVRTLLGDIALILRTDRPELLRIGVAGASRSLTMAVRTTDARRWADSATLLLAAPRRLAAPRKARSADSVERRRAVLDEPGVGSGTFVFLRMDSAGTRSFMLFVDDAALDGIRQPLDPEEAKLLIGLVRRAATPARARPVAPKKGVKKSVTGKDASRSGGAPKAGRSLVSPRR